MLLPQEAPGLTLIVAPATNWTALAMMRPSLPETPVPRV